MQAYKCITHMCIHWIIWSNLFMVQSSIQNRNSMGRLTLKCNILFVMQSWESRDSPLCRNQPITAFVWFFVIFVTQLRTALPSSVPQKTITVLRKLLLKELILTISCQLMNWRWSFICLRHKNEPGTAQRIVSRFTAELLCHCARWIVCIHFHVAVKDIVHPKSFFSIIYSPSCCVYSHFIISVEHKRRC